MYLSKYICQDFSLKGGNIPLNNSHSIIERPELVSQVKPPIIIIEKTNNNNAVNQYKNKLLIFTSFMYIFIIYIQYIDLKFLNCRDGK